MTNRVTTFIKLIIITSVLFIQKPNAQEDYLGTRIILNSDGFSNESIYIYTPPFKAAALYTDLSQVKNEYPEELMSSILCASTQDWVNYNTLGGEDEAEIKDSSEFEKIKHIDNEKTYFELLSKLTFKENNSEMAIIKFYFHDKDKEKPIAGALVMQKLNERWYKTSTPYTTPIAMALMVFKVEVMERLLKNQPLNEIEKKLLNSVFTKNGFNFDKLLQQKLGDEEKKYFTNPLNW